MEIYHGIKGNFLSVSMTTFSPRAHIYLQLNSSRKERSIRKESAKPLDLPRPPFSQRPKTGSVLLMRFQKH